MVISKKRPNSISFPCEEMRRDRSPPPFPFLPSYFHAGLGKRGPAVNLSLCHIMSSIPPCHWCPIPGGSRLNRLVNLTGPRRSHISQYPGLSLKFPVQAPCLLNSLFSDLKDRISKGPSPVIWLSLPILSIVELFAWHLFQVEPGFQIKGPHMSCPVHSLERKRQGLSQASDNDSQFWPHRPGRTCSLSLGESRHRRVNRNRDTQFFSLFKDGMVRGVINHGVAIV